jgi:hypothetical protein
VVKTTADEAMSTFGHRVWCRLVGVARTGRRSVTGTRLAIGTIFGD